MEQSVAVPDIREHTEHQIDLTGDEQRINGHRSDQHNMEDPRKLARLGDLPDELLIRIFIKGCEDDTYSENHPYPRHLKKFALVASRVDQRWRKLIQTNKIFWISRILLEVNAFRDDEALGHSFVKGLMDFRRQLLISDGCDLVILFNFSVARKWEENIPSLDAFPRPVSIAIRLDLHSMEIMVPYYRQITLLQVRSTHPQVLFHLLEIITTRWEVAPRLSEIRLKPATWWNRDKPMSDLITNPDLCFAGVLQTRSPIPRSGSVRFFHLHSLDTLEVPNCSWLDGEPQLPPALSRLVIAVVGPQSIPALHRFLVAQRALCEHIKSIVMGISGHEHVQEKLERDEWRISSQIVLPQLRSISLSGVISLHARQFLESSTLPLLEDISLMGLDHSMQLQYRTLSGDEAPALDAIFTSGDSDQHTPFYENKTLPALRKLTLEMDWFSFPALACISILPHNQIDTLSIFLEDDNSDTSPPSTKFGSLLEEILSKFQPRHLLLEDVSYEITQFILRSMDTRLAESLSIRTKYSKRDALELINRPPCLEFRPDQRVSMPHLSSLQLSGSEVPCIHILSHLHAKSLERLDLDIVGGGYWRSRRTWIQRKSRNVLFWNHEHGRTTTIPLPSVRFVKYNLPGHSLDSLLHWQFLPGVEELCINISSHTTSSDFLKKPYGSLTKLSASLKPTTSGSVPFPRVRTLLVSSQNFISRESSDPELSNPNSESLRLVIDGLLKSRQKFNRALLLQLDEPPHISFESDGSTYFGVTLNVSFRASVRADSLVTTPWYQMPRRIGLGSLVGFIKRRHVGAKNHKDGGRIE